jgi:hypothetical protein
MADQERLRQKAFSTYNVTGCYPDMERARDAVETLERAGVAASSISLLGPGAEEAVEQPDTAQRDERMLDKGMKATLGGAAAGSGIGGALGFLAGAAAFGIPGVGPAIGAGVWAATIGGAAAGGGVGFTAGAMTQLKQSEAWELTLQDVQAGRVVVGVHTDDEDEHDKAAEALRGTDPQSFNRFDADGRRINDA